jgi:hypothetical protein
MTFEQWWKNLVKTTAMPPFGQSILKDIAKEAWEQGYQSADADPIIAAIREDNIYEKY